MKAPLKSPLSDLKSVSAIKSMIPRGSAVHTALLYDGNLELGLSEHAFVVAHTNKYVVYEMWRCLIEDPQRVAAFVEHMHPIEDKNVFYLLQENWPKYPDPFVRAGLFILLNRYSDTGLISSGDMNVENYSPLAVVDLKKAVPPSNLYLALDDEGDFLEPFKNLDSRCDYLVLPLGRYKIDLLMSNGKETHEETKVDHEKVYDFFKTSDNKTYLVYEYSTAVVNKYKGYNQHIVDKWGRQTESDKFAKELIVANF